MSGGTKSGWSLSSGSAQHQPGVGGAHRLTPSTSIHHNAGHFASANNSSDRQHVMIDSPRSTGSCSSTCLRVAIIVTPILGLCTLVPLVVVALRLLGVGSRSRQARPRLILMPPVLRPEKTEPKSPNYGTIKDSVADRGGTETSATLCLCGSNSRMEFVVLTAPAAAQNRRSPGSGYRQMQTSTIVGHCPSCHRCCQQRWNFEPSVRDVITDRTDLDGGGDFIWPRLKIIAWREKNGAYLDGWKRVVHFSCTSASSTVLKPMQYLRVKLSLSFQLQIT